MESTTMAMPSPPSPAFSPVYFSSQNGEDNERDNSDFYASSSIVDASSVPDVDTIDNSSHSAISPAARRIIFGDDCDDDVGYEDGNISRRHIPLGVPLALDYDEGEEITSSNHHKTSNRRESRHSLPKPEEHKLSVAAAGRGGWLSFLSSNFKKIIYPALLFILALVIMLLFTLGAIAGVSNREATTEIRNNQKDTIFENFDDSEGIPYSGQFDDRWSHLQNYMVKHGVTEPNHFDTINTPQSQAIRWLANEDRHFPILPTHDQDLTTPEGYSLVTRYAMAVLYFATDGKNWNNSLNFLDPNKATCDWFQILAPPKGEVGVLCNQTTRRVIGLSLISNNVVGKIPSELSQITSLEYLESIENQLLGTIPSEWQKLTGLRTIVMAFNQLTGNLPSWMPQVWPDMEFMYLSNNAISGTIPDEFFEFQKLSVLALDDNILTGKTDVIWNSMQSLEYLYLEDNYFTGTLPSLFSKFNSALINLDISSNQLSGTLPPDLFQLNRLEILDLHDNRFDSNLPSMIPENNNRLKFLALQKNMLLGTIPSTIANLRVLSHLDVTNNNLTGTIPKELERLSDTMTYLFLGANHYHEGPIPSLVYALTNLRELSLKSSKRTGTIAGVIGALDAMLVLDLDDNRLTGSIPNEIGMMTKLQFLLLNRNQFSSSVPGHALAKLEKLRFLLLDQNHVFGDLNPICGLEFLSAVYVDCGEVSCLEGCCSCCTDGQTCHDNVLINNHDPVWEADYTRQFFDFSEGDGGRFYSNRDDDYW